MSLYWQLWSICSSMLFLWLLWKLWCGAQLYLGQNFEAPFWWNSTRLLQIYIQKQVKAKGHNNFSTEKGYRAHNEVIGWFLIWCSNGNIKLISEELGLTIKVSISGCHLQVPGATPSSLYRKPIGLCNAAQWHLAIWLSTTATKAKQTHREYHQ